MKLLVSVASYWTSFSEISFLLCVIIMSETCNSTVRLMLLSWLTLWYQQLYQSLILLALPHCCFWIISVNVNIVKKASNILLRKSVLDLWSLLWVSCTSCSIYILYVSFVVPIVFIYVVCVNPCGTLGLRTTDWDI